MHDLVQDATGEHCLVSQKLQLQLSIQLYAEPLKSIVLLQSCTSRSTHPHGECVLSMAPITSHILSA